MPISNKDSLKLIAGLSTVGIEMGANIAIGLMIGLYLDKRFNTGKTLTIIFLIFGILGAFKALYVAARKAGTKQQKKNNNGDIN